MSDAAPSTAAATEVPAPSSTTTGETENFSPEAPRIGEDGKAASLLDTKQPAAPSEAAAEPVAPFDPEKLTLAEGFTKDELYNDFVAWAAKRNISQEMGQELIDFWTKGAQSNAVATEKAWLEQNEKWQAEVKSDPDIGGSKLPGVLQTVAKVLDNPRYFDPTIRQLLATSGLGNNREFIKGFHQMCVDLTEGHNIAGNPPGMNGRYRSIAERLYPE
jgi:hypothetical protein